MTNTIIRKLGPYSLTELLGRGSTGIVYKAYDKDANRYVAVKTLAAEFSSDPALHNSFYQEAKLAVNLRHPHIVRIYQLGEADGEIFIAMELLQGHDLKQVLKQGLGIAMEQKLQWMIQLARALSYAHGEGIIHGDIKPGNLHICDDSRLVVMDFGIARAANVPHHGHGVTGTPDYISPEQILAVRSDHRADIFAMGIVFYELLTEKHPFRGRNLPATIYRILNETPAPVQELNPQVSAKLSRLVLRAMERNVNSRFQNCEDLLQDLESISSSFPRT